MKAHRLFHRPGQWARSGRTWFTPSGYHGTETARKESGIARNSRFREAVRYYALASGEISSRLRF